MGIHRDGDSELVSIHDAMLDGGRIKMIFPSHSEFNSFRTMLYRYKNYYENLQSGIPGMEDNKKSILVETGQVTDDGQLEYFIQFGKLTEKKKYTFQIVDEEEIENGVANG